MRQVEAVLKVKVYQDNVIFKLVPELNRDRDSFKDLVRKVRAMFQLTE